MYLQGIMTNVHFVDDVIGQLEIIVAHVGVAELGSRFTKDGGAHVVAFKRSGQHESEWYNDIVFCHAF